MSDSFDRALRAAARRGRPAGECPGADLLAAYADGRLDAQERRDLERHAADCPSCLQHLALLGAISVPQPRQDEHRLPWFAHWRWLVPVATVVLVVTVWSGLPEDLQAPLPGPRQETASRGTGSEPAASQAHAPPATAAEQQKVTPTPTRRALQDDQPSDARAQPGPAAAPQEQSGTRAEAPEPTMEARREPASRPRTGSARAPDAPGAAPPRAAAPAAVGDADSPKSVVGTREGVLRDEAASGPEALRQKGAGEPGLSMHTPWGDRYRAMEGHVELSRDGGLTWHQVAADPQVTWLELACWSPDRICWAGGTRGALVRLRDDEATRADLPIGSAVRAVAPQGRENVLVTVEGGSAFRTTDGGRTWEPEP